MTTVAKNVRHTGITITKVELELSFCPEFPAAPPSSPALVVGFVDSSLDVLIVSIPDTRVEAGEVSVIGFEVEERAVFLTVVDNFNVVVSMCVVGDEDGGIGGAVGSVFGGAVDDDDGEVVVEVVNFDVVDVVAKVVDGSVDGGSVVDGSAVGTVDDRGALSKKKNNAVVTML